MRIALVLVVTVFLIACGEDNQTATATEQSPVKTELPAKNPTNDEIAAEYEKKVHKKVSNSVVNSLAREWGVPNEKITCLLNDLRITQLQDPTSGPAVLEVFKKCGVDPAVAD